LEIASGTGQHCIYFSEKFSNLEWQPSDIDKKRLDSIEAYIQEITLANIKRPLLIDATVEKWDPQINNYDAIIAINILHLISFKEMKNLVKGSSSALKSNGHLIVYGPFMRGSELTSDEDIKFHSSLVACDPEIGYKDDFDILDEIEANNLCPEAVIEMPANNLMFIAKK
jgi:cyclopropane fatty-acyl-phospholipid synthase-like methyltransferase